MELLLLPEIFNNSFNLTKIEWIELQNWINANIDAFPLRILDRARNYLDIPVLFNENSYYQDYLYLNANKILKTSSYDSMGQNLILCDLERQLKKWRNESTT
ncbi:hypothetical protein ES708_25441 [subsurface metagenome]